MDAAINMFTAIQQSATSELTSVPAHLGTRRTWLSRVLLPCAVRCFASQKLCVSTELSPCPFRVATGLARCYWKSNALQKAKAQLKPIQKASWLPEIAEDVEHGLLLLAKIHFKCVPAFTLIDQDA